MSVTEEIKFYNFPHDFDSEANFFRDVTQEAVARKPTSIPIHFYGCYPKVSTFKRAILYLHSRISDSGMTKWLNLQQGVVVPYNPNALNIWCTFENRRPPVERFDFTFSFDVDSYGGTNCYLPLIYLYMNHNKKKNLHAKHSLSTKVASQRREIEKNFFEKKTGFAVAFINNPHPMRFRAIRDLSKVGEVDLFGRSVNNYIKDKIGRAEKYWFNLCFENDLYPGYVTEKILEAWISKSVPLYWGSDEAGILNSEAYVNLNDFKSLVDFVDYVSALYLDKDRMVEMINQPLLNQAFDYEAILDFLIKGLEVRAEQAL